MFITTAIITVWHSFIANQRRNEGGQGGNNSPGTKWLQGHQKVPTTSQVLSSVQYICFWKTCFDHGSTKLASCPGRHLTSLCHCCQWNNTGKNKVCTVITRRGHGNLPICSYRHDKVVLRTTALRIILHIDIQRKLQMGRTRKYSTGPRLLGHSWFSLMDGTG